MARISGLIAFLLFSYSLYGQDDSITYLVTSSTIEFPKVFTGCSNMNLVKVDNSSSTSVFTIYNITSSIDFSAMGLSAADNGSTWIVTIPPQTDIELVGNCSISIDVKKSKESVKN